jgi:hypothetical protein
MPIFFMFSIVTQVICGIHAVKTGRERWLFVIIFFSLAGSLIYFFVELLPDLRHQPVALKAGSSIFKLLDPGRELRYLRDQLSRADSISNRKALADGYVQAGFFKDAINLYQTCLQGTYADDPAIMEGLSLAYFFQEDYAAAKKYLLRLKEIRGEKTPHEFKLLLARTYEGSGEQENALNEYRNLLRFHSGEEARYLYALLLKNSGSTQKANELFRAIVAETRIQPKFYRRSQKKWVELAKKEIQQVSNTFS